MEPIEYVFHIDVFSPTTLPMRRLASYLAALAKMMGYEDHTHFVAVEKGSARLLAAVDAVDAPKVAARLESVGFGEGPKDAEAARQELETLLANDNAVATLSQRESGRVIVPFLGRNRPKPLSFPPFREDTSIDGMLVSIGGRDSSAHAQLQDGDVIHTGLTMDRTMAQKLAPLLYGPPLRLHGNGRFERQADGNWTMTDFRLDSYEQLDSRPLTAVLDAMRAVPGNRLMDESAYQDIARLRQDGDGDQ